MTPWSSASSDADHRAGTSSSTVVPSPGLGADRQRAARLGDEAFEQRQPDVAVRGALLAVARGEAAAVVGDDEPGRRPAPGA